MADESVKNEVLSKNVVVIEKYLDALMSEQRKAAHNAIDMNDWNTAGEIVAVTKRNIGHIETLKKMLSDFKDEAGKLDLELGEKMFEALEKENSSGIAQVESPKKADAFANAPKSDSTAATAPKTEQTAPQKKDNASANAPKTENKTIAANAAATAPAPTPAPKAGSAAAPKKDDAANVPKEETKPAEQPKSSSSADVNSENINDANKSAINPIVTACEELISQYPFSMRLINTNPKIGRYFTDDKLTACTNMSKAELLSNGLWVETDIVEGKMQMFIRGLKKYCEESVNM